MTFFYVNTWPEFRVMAITYGCVSLSTGFLLIALAIWGYKKLKQQLDEIEVIVLNRKPNNAQQQHAYSDTSQDLDLEKQTTHAASRANSTPNTNSKSTPTSRRPTSAMQPTVEEVVEVTEVPVEAATSRKPSTQPATPSTPNRARASTVGQTNPVPLPAMQSAPSPHPQSAHPAASTDGTQSSFEDERVFGQPYLGWQRSVVSKRMRERGPMDGANEFYDVLLY